MRILNRAEPGKQVLMAKTFLLCRKCLGVLGHAWRAVNVDVRSLRLWQHARLNGTAALETIDPKSAAATNGTAQRSAATNPVSESQTQTLASVNANGRANQ